MYVTKFYCLGVCGVGVGVACSFQGRISYTAGPDVKSNIFIIDEEAEAQHRPELPFLTTPRVSQQDCGPVLFPCIHCQLRIGVLNSLFPVSLQGRDELEIIFESRMPVHFFFL